jgi:hypothetical protein
MNSAANNSNMNFDPLAAPVDNTNSNTVTYPTAHIVLIDEHANHQEAASQFPVGQVSIAPEPYSYQNYQPQGNIDGIGTSTSTSNSNSTSNSTSTSTSNSNSNSNSDDNYASAQVVDPGYNPYQNEFYATETYATATPLDPWTKAPTASTEQMQNNNTSSGQQPVNVVQPTNTVPLIALEDHLHKKHRRRRRRRGRMALSGVAGFVFGSFAGPLGAIAGAASGVALARAASKAGERKKDRRVQAQVDQSFQQHQEQLQLNRSQQLARM